MNKKLPIHLMLLLQLVAPVFIYSQDVKKWNFGVSAGQTYERFGVTRKFKNQNRIISTQDYKAGSLANYNTAIWVERKLSSTFSLIPQLSYQFVHIHDNILSGGLSKSGSGDNLKETHHYVSLAIHLRKYIELNSRLKFFADAGVKADRLVYFKNEYWVYKNEVWNPTVSNNINPAIVLAAGVRRGRWALAAEYQYFLGTPFVKKYRGNSEASGTETNLERQNLSIKAAFAILK